MADQRKGAPKGLLARIATVTNKRARFVLESIVKNGSVTTEEINHAGYDHPPRAVQDAKDLGFRIKRFTVKHTNGRAIAAYTFDDGELDPTKVGRRALPKKERDAIINRAGAKCQICSFDRNLQVDHRIPYEVAGETLIDQEHPFQVLCGSCNRKKSWDCEHCRNRLDTRDADVCRSCYWADPATYTHVAMHQQRRADVVWSESEIKKFEEIRIEAIRHNRTVSEQINDVLKHKC